MKSIHQLRGKVDEYRVATALKPTFEDNPRVAHFINLEIIYNELDFKIKPQRFLLLKQRYEREADERRQIRETFIHDNFVVKSGRSRTIKRTQITIRVGTQGNIQSGA